MKELPEKILNIIGQRHEVVSDERFDGHSRILELAGGYELVVGKSPVTEKWGLYACSEHFPDESWVLIHAQLREIDA